MKHRVTNSYIYEIINLKEEIKERKKNMVSKVHFKRKFCGGFWILKFILREKFDGEQSNKYF